MPFSPAVEACRVADEQLAEAYEATSARHRSWIKTTLALIESVTPSRPALVSTRIENPAAGFAQTRTRESAPWVVLLIGEGTVSAVRLAAAIMPARLAGVESILAVWTGAGTMPHAVIAALELTGVEQVFALPDPAPLLNELTGRGRLLRFGNAPVSMAACPIWKDRAPRLEHSALPEDALRAHPDALPAAANADASYAGQMLLGEAAPLVLGPGLEGCWLHTDLTPDFFLNERLELAAIPQEA